MARQVPPVEADTWMAWGYVTQTASYYSMFKNIISLAQGENL